MKYSREIRIGLFIIAAAAMVIFGIGVLQGRSIFATTFELEAIYDDVDNMTVGSKVLINGFQVGQVQEIEYRVAERNVRIKFDLTQEIPIPVDSRAVLDNLDFLGSKCLRLELGQSRQMVESGARLPGITEAGMIDKFVGKIDPLAARIDTVLADLQVISKSIRETINDSTNRVNNIARNVENLSTELNRITQQFGQTARRVDGLVIELQGLVAEVKKDGNVGRILANTARMSDTLALTASKARQVVELTRSTAEELKTVIFKINQGEGTAGRLINDPKLYDNLERTTRGLDSLVLDLKARPGRYLNFSVFGKKDK